MSEAKTTDNTRDELHGILCRVTIAGEAVRSLARLNEVGDTIGGDDWSRIRSFVLHAVADNLDVQAAKLDAIWLDGRDAPKAAA